MDHMRRLSLGRTFSPFSRVVLAGALLASHSFPSRTVSMKLHRRYASVRARTSLVSSCVQSNHIFIQEVLKSLLFSHDSIEDSVTIRARLEPKIIPNPSMSDELSSQLRSGDSHKGQGEAWGMTPDSPGSSCVCPNLLAAAAQALDASVVDPPLLFLPESDWDGTPFLFTLSLELIFLQLVVHKETMIRQVRKEYGLTDDD